MKRLLISQPMFGKTNEEILEERKKAVVEVEKMIKEPVTLLDSYFPREETGEPGEPGTSGDVPAEESQPLNEGLFCLGSAIIMLACADVAYFARGWDKARGCLIEHECAVEYGIETIIAYPTSGN